MNITSSECLSRNVTMIHFRRRRCGVDVPPPLWTINAISDRFHATVRACWHHQTLLIPCHLRYISCWYAFWQATGWSGGSLKGRFYRFCSWRKVYRRWWGWLIQCTLFIAHDKVYPKPSQAKRGGRTEGNLMSNWNPRLKHALRVYKATEIEAPNHSTRTSWNKNGSVTPTTQRWPKNEWHQSSTPNRYFVVIGYSGSDDALSLSQWHLHEQISILIHE